MLRMLRMLRMSLYMYIRSFPVIIVIVKDLF